LALTTPIQLAVSQDRPFLSWLDLFTPSVYASDTKGPALSEQLFQHETMLGWFVSCFKRANYDFQANLKS